MNLRLVSYNGVNINDAVNYNAFISDDIKLQGDARIVQVSRAGRRPIHASKILQGYELRITVQMLGTVATQLNALKSIFDVEDEIPRQLIVRNTADADRRWHVFATVRDMPAMKTHRSVEVILSVADPVWLREVESSDTWSITASGQQRTVAVGGNVFASPRFVLTPTTGGGNRFANRRLAIWRNPTSSALLDYPLNLVGTTWDTAALVSGGFMQANGNDLRVFVNGQETSRWLQGINTTTTTVWAAIDFQPGITLTLGTSIAGSGSITTITMANTAANRAAIRRLPRTGMVYIGTELFTYTGVNISERRLTGCTRAIKGTSMEAHSPGAAVHWIEHEIWIYYGNSTMTAPETDEARRPIIELTSTNGVWTYNDFTNEARRRSGRWTPALIKTVNTSDPVNVSEFYTGNRTAAADPATEMGMSLRAWQSGQGWRIENGTVEWSFFHPAGITHISSSGERFRVSANWPSAQFMRSADGRKWAAVWTDTAPSATGTWEALTARSNVALPAGSTHVKFSLSGRLGATALNAAHYEIETVTLTLASAGVPQGVFLAAESCYFLDSVLTNNRTGEWIRFRTSVMLNNAVTIDCENKLAFLHDGTPISNVEFSSVRRAWLNLLPGNNQLQFDDVGTGNITCGIFWRERNS